MNVKDICIAGLMGANLCFFMAVFYRSFEAAWTVNERANFLKKCQRRAARIYYGRKDESDGSN